MAYGCGYDGGYADIGCVTVPGCAGGGYGYVRYGGAPYGGGGNCSVICSDTDEEIAGHEYAGLCVNTDAEFPDFSLPFQTYGCGNGYAGGQFAALMYGGGVPCNGMSPTPPPGPTPGGVTSNVEEFCILDASCG